MQYTKLAEALQPLLRFARIPLAGKKIMSESILTQTLMYRTETWTTNIKDRGKMQVSEMKVLRLIPT